MRSSRPTLFVPILFTLIAAVAASGFAQEMSYPPNPGIFQGVTAPLSPALRFWASDAGKKLLLHSPSPMALGLLRWFHPEAVGLYPQEPLLKPGPVGSPRAPSLSVTGCGTVSGTVMNLELAVNAVGQYEPKVDFLLSALGSGKDLVAEFGNDNRFSSNEFDSESVMYVHRDPNQPCYGGTDFEMGTPPIANPFFSDDPLSGIGGGRILADPGTGSRPAQFILADLRYDRILGMTSGIGLRRIPAGSLESTTTCPAGTLTASQEATCAGATAILVGASLDNQADTPAIAQDPRSTGTGAGDIYVISPSIRDLRTVILISACKATFTTTSDCSAPLILNGTHDAGLPSVAVVGGGPNAGAITISFVSSSGFQFISCTPAGAPNPPVCGNASEIYFETSPATILTDNPGLDLEPWPQIAARTDSGGQTLFVVWSDCKVEEFEDGLAGCPQAQIVMSTATSLTSPIWTFHNVTGASGHHFLPSVAYDSGQNIVTIGYYSTGSNAYKNAVRMAVNQIPPGSVAPGSTVYLTSNYDSVEGDGTSPGFGEVEDFVGIAAHGGSGSGSSRLYLGFTSNARQGSYGGINNSQADNNITRATY
jgi:hypothetical protein